eukprot:g78445.t1
MARSPPTYSAEITSSTAHRTLQLLYCVLVSLDLLRNPDWTDAEKFFTTTRLPGHDFNRWINRVTTGHYSVGYSHWCHTCLSIELSWSNYCVARWKLFCDDDPFKLPFDVFGSHNSYADTIDSGPAHSPDVYCYTSTATVSSTLHATDTQHALPDPRRFVYTISP